MKSCSLLTITTYTDFRQRGSIDGLDRLVLSYFTDMREHV
jgi:hypothetical protein